MVTPKKIIIKDLELADEEIARLRKENKELKKDKKLLLSDYELLLKDKRELDRENKELKEEVRQWKEYQKKSQDRDGEDIERLLGENIKLKAQIAEYDDLTEELDYRKREAKRLGWNSKNAKENFNK